MKTRWLKDLTRAEDKKKRRQQIFEAKPVLDHLATMLQEDLDNSIRQMSDRDTVLKSSNLEDTVAHYLGEQDTLRKVITLLKLEGK